MGKFQCLRAMLAAGVCSAGISLSGFSATPAAAFETTAEAAAKARHRINIAGRQRMLTQRMTKAVCMALTSGDAARWSEEAYIAAITFEDTLGELLNGSKDGKVKRAEAQSERAALEKVFEVSEGFTASVRQIASRDLNSAAMTLILERNLPTLTRMNSAVGQMERLLGGSDVSAAKASTINQAGRQRMLSQRIAKDLCFVGAGFNEDEARAALGESVALFSVTLNGLRVGDESRGLLAPPTPVIATRLSQVQERWDRILPVAKEAIAGAQISAQTLADTVAEADALLVDMNDAVRLWAEQSG